MKQTADDSTPYTSLLTQTHIGNSGQKAPLCCLASVLTTSRVSSLAVSFRLFYAPPNNTVNHLELADLSRWNISSRLMKPSLLRS